MIIARLNLRLNQKVQHQAPVIILGQPGISVYCREACHFNVLIDTVAG